MISLRLLSVALFLVGMLCLEQAPRAQLTLTGVGGASGGASAFNTLDPAKKGTSIALSGGNLTATNTAASNGSVLAVSGATTGKRYFEGKYTTCATVAHCVIGIGDGSTNLNSFLGVDTHSGGWGGDGTIFTFLPGTAIQTFAVNDVLCVAVDLGNGKIWFRTNGGNWNNDVIGNQDPANNIGGKTFASLTGTIFPAVGTFQDATVATVNFGATAYAQTVPIGYINW